MANLPPLAEWAQTQYGKGQRFKSARSLSLRAGLNQNAVTYIVERGQAGPETLVKLARTVGENPLRLFRMAGWIEDGDLSEGATRPMPDGAADLLQLYESADARGRQLLLRLARTVAETPDDESEELPLRKVAEERSNYRASQGRAAG